MRALTAIQREHALAVTKSPIWVIEVQFINGAVTAADGGSLEGVNDFYFASADKTELNSGLLDPLPIDNRWGTMLDPSSISSVGQRLDAITGITSIGTLSFSIIDIDGYFSDVVATADAAGFGLNRQTVNLFLLYAGDSWGDRLLIRRMQIEAVSQLNGSYRIQCADVQRLMRESIFDASTAALSSNVSIGATTVILTSYYPGSFFFIDGVSHININGECMRVVSPPVDSGVLTFSVVRKALGTVEAAHKQGDDVSEVLNFVGEPVSIALALLSGYWGVPVGVGLPNLPEDWHCGMSAVNHIDLPEWLLVQETNSTAGIIFDFVFTEGFDVKNFTESEIMRVLGLYMWVKNDGKLGLKKYQGLYSNSIAADAISDGDYLSSVIDDGVCTKWGELKILEKGTLATTMKVSFDDYPRLGGKFRRHVILTAASMREKHGKGRPLKMVSRGVVASSASSVDAVMARAALVLSRYTAPALGLGVTCLPKMHPLEVGDNCRVRLPLTDVYTGSPLNRIFEVVSKSMLPKTGEVKLELLAQAEAVTIPVYQRPQSSLRPDSVFLNGLSQNIIPTSRDLLTQGVSTLVVAVDPLDPTHLILTGLSHGLTTGDWYIPIATASPIINVTVDGVWGIYGTVRIWCNKRLRIAASNINGSGRSDAVNGQVSAGGAGSAGRTVEWWKDGGQPWTSTEVGVDDGRGTTAAESAPLLAIALNAAGTRMNGVPISLGGGTGGRGGDGLGAASQIKSKNRAVSQGIALSPHAALPAIQGSSGALGGAGLMICARRIEFTAAARVNLSGAGGTLGGVVLLPETIHENYFWATTKRMKNDYFGGYSGGGGGGALLCIAENDVLNGTVFIDPVHYNIRGGLASNANTGGDGLQITRYI